MSQDQSSPIYLTTKSAQKDKQELSETFATFDSYAFERNVLVPASAFRFTASGADSSQYLNIRSCDLVALSAVNQNNQTQQLAVGIIDQTDTEITPQNVTFSITGRDMLGQLVDNATVDSVNKIINTTDTNIETLVKLLIKNTRIPQQFILQNVPNGKLLIQTSPSETKITTLQRYLEFMNCLVWTNSTGQVVVGKPNFAQSSLGNLVISSTDPLKNNCLNARVKRGVNQAIRQIVTQLQTLNLVDAGSYTVFNQDQDMLAVAQGGRSVYDRFTYGQGEDSVNQLTQVGNQSGVPRKIGEALSNRTIARENINILDVEIVVEGHFNDSGLAYNIDQVYNVQIEDEDLDEDMYVYGVSYELTLSHGKITKLKLCRLGTTLVGDGAALLGVAQ